MKQVTLEVPEFVFAFYEKVGQQAGGLAPETVMADGLLRLAGDLSLNVIRDKQK